MHIVQAAYGWSDKKVLNIRIARLVQMINVLNAADDIRRMEIEWQGKLIAKTVANTIDDPKSREKMLAAIEQMNLRGLESDEPASTTRAADTKGDGRSVEDIIENGSVDQALARNNRRKGPGIGSLSFRAG